MKETLYAVIAAHYVISKQCEIINKALYGVPMEDHDPRSEALANIHLALDTLGKTLQDVIDKNL